MYHFLFPYGMSVWKDIKKTEFIMIAILTDKPSVGKEIGRIIGATKVRNGYVEGNGYMVTWTFGNMLSLAMPKDYGTQKLERNDFPFIPSEFELMVRHTRTENGWIPEIDAVLQLKVIEKVFQACDTIIAATDASRDGEMTFRYVYQYLNCTQPCLRLWISSLTDESVRKGMENLKPDSCYDSLFLAADSRNKADWILGINASYAMCKATGLGVQGDRTRQQFPRTGTDTGTGCHQQTLPRKGEPYFIGQLAHLHQPAKGRYPFQDAPHAGSSRQRIRNNVFSGLQVGTSGTDYRYQSQRKGNTSTGSA